MSNDDPVRLKDQRAASPELVRALRALGTSSDAARLERVAQKLGAAIGEGQPPMAASGAGVLGVKVLVVGLVAAGIAALAWFGSNTRTPAPPPPAPPAEVQWASPPPPPTAAVEPSAPRAELPTPLSTPVKTSSRHAPSRTRAAATAPASAEPRASSAPAATAVATTTPTASAATAPAPAPRSDDSAHKPAAPQPSAAEPEPPAPSEAALLFGARKAMAAQPSAALLLLDQHAARFPEGLLTPEREVLRIETLHRLGRTSEAEQRLRAFQARYPDSIHLRRLQKLIGGEH